eukprot:CAMPEP_0204629172 /NCGR_PEP_ID=MMETSP0717-20131115/17578_1 /ASSEMBLY_ACC=CAM_ASM_000666 /TAXON_ID=230516 /ORGANISM="Chaetoceros curvisetus" /LENGTH=138 /DNA_ID=CAMNT_0051646027 /DNA_START=111 /DNA_END=527 /DNA_ORIENTATION=+
MTDNEKQSNTPQVTDSGEAKSFAMPALDLKSAIKVAVVKTNGILSTLENQKDATSDFVGSRVRPLAVRLGSLAKSLIVKYEMREYYGPQIIAGSTATIGGLVSMRRGKIPGVFMGALAGITSYGAVYGDIPAFAKKWM